MKSGQIHTRFVFENQTQHCASILSQKKYFLMIFSSMRLSKETKIRKVHASLNVNCNHRPHSVRILNQSVAIKIFICIAIQGIVFYSSKYSSNHFQKTTWNVWQMWIEYFNGLVENGWKFFHINNQLESKYLSWDLISFALPYKSYHISETFCPIVNQSKFVHLAKILHTCVKTKIFIYSGLLLQCSFSLSEEYKYFMAKNILW